MNIFLLYFLLLRATVTSFSGYASVPVIREDLVVRRAVLTDTELNVALAISQASPGPLGLYVVIVGYFVAGVAGAALGVLALAIPAILAIPILLASRRGRTEHIQAGGAAIVIASSALMLLAAVQLAPTAIPTLRLSLIALVGLIALASGRISPLYVVILSGMMGLLV